MQITKDICLLDSGWKGPDWMWVELEKGGRKIRVQFYPHTPSYSIDIFHDNQMRTRYTYGEWPKWLKEIL